MTRIFPIMLLALICSALNLHAQQRAKKVVFIIADGIPADVLEKVNTPNLDKIIKTGAYKRASVGGEKNTYTQTPTISAPGYMDLITGTWGYKHQVWDNDVQAPNYNYKNIFRLLKQQYPQKKIGIFSTWQDNRTKLVGEAIDTAGNVHFDYKYDGYELDTMAFPHDQNKRYIHLIDERVVAAATACIRKDAPDLSWVYLEYTDDMGHRYGDSEQLYQAVGDLDKQIGDIREAINYRQKHFPEDWLIIITTDHGRDAETGKGHGGQSDRERTTWIVMNAADTNAYFKQATPAIVDLLPTITRFMQLKLTDDEQAELDGIPLTGAVSIYNPEINIENKKLLVTWKALVSKGELEVFIATTNYYQKGMKDQYRSMGKFPVHAGKALIPMIPSPGGFYKVVLKAPHHTVNRWVIPEKK